MHMLIVSPYNNSFIRNLHTTENDNIKLKYAKSFSPSGPRAWYLDLTIPRNASPHRLFKIKSLKNKISHQIHEYESQSDQLKKQKKNFQHSIDYVSFLVRTINIFK